MKNNKFNLFILLLLSIGNVKSAATITNGDVSLGEFFKSPKNAAIGIGGVAAGVLALNSFCKMGGTNTLGPVASSVASLIAAPFSSDNPAVNFIGCVAATALAGFAAKRAYTGYNQYKNEKIDKVIDSIRTVNPNKLSDIGYSNIQTAIKTDALINNPDALTEFTQRAILLDIISKHTNNPTTIEKALNNEKKEFIDLREYLKKNNPIKIDGDVVSIDGKLTVVNKVDNHPIIGYSLNHAYTSVIDRMNRLDAFKDLVNKYVRQEGTGYVVTLPIAALPIARA